VPAKKKKKKRSEGPPIAKRPLEINGKIVGRWLPGSQGRLKRKKKKKKNVQAVCKHQRSPVKI